MATYLSHCNCMCVCVGCSLCLNSIPLTTGICFRFFISSPRPYVPNRHSKYLTHSNSSSFSTRESEKCVECVLSIWAGGVSFLLHVFLCLLYCRREERIIKDSQSRRWRNSIEYVRKNEQIANNILFLIHKIYESRGGQYQTIR